jgi:hypothetical protein
MRRWYSSSRAGMPPMRLVNSTNISAVPRAYLVEVFNAALEAEGVGGMDCHAVASDWPRIGSV